MPFKEKTSILLTLIISILISVNAQSQCTQSCFIACDSTFQNADLDGYGGLNCDDCSSQEIQLPFSYNFCGTSYNSLYINSNGNITFSNPFATFTPIGFPNNSTEKMIAPFWSDVDLNGACGNICYKIDSNKIIVNWEEVGHFVQNCDLSNTFQAILTNGTDPLIGIGNNTAFFYEDMNWTTGDASGGIDGFGGANAIVGINVNDGINFNLIGEFNQAGNSFPIIDSTGSVLAGQIDWLDNRCITFDASLCNADYNINEPCFINAGNISVQENIYQYIDTAINVCINFDQQPYLEDSAALSFLLVDNINNAILQTSNSNCFLIDEPGNFEIYTIVYDSNYLNLDTINFGTSSLFYLDSVLNQNCICNQISEPASFSFIDCYDVIDAGTFEINNDSTFFYNDTAQVYISQNSDSILSANYSIYYLLVSNANNQILDWQINDSTLNNLSLTNAGNYTIHSLAMNENDFSIIESSIISSTLVDLSQTIINNGFCANLSLNGTNANVYNCSAFNSDFSFITNIFELEDSLITVCAIINYPTNLPDNSVEIYILVEDGVMIDSSSLPCFEITEEGNYTVHSFIYNPMDAWNNLFYFNTLAGFISYTDTINQYCFSLDEVGESFEVVLDCAGTYSSLSLTNDSIPLTGTLVNVCANIDSIGNIPFGYEEAFILVRNDTIIDIEGITPCFDIYQQGNYSIHSILSTNFQLPFWIDIQISTLQEIINITENTNWCYGIDPNGVNLIVYEPTVNIYEINESFDISFYPNPVADKLIVDFKNEILDELKIYNAAGKLIKTYNNNLQGTKTIYFNNYSAGIYYIEFFNDGKSKREKIILN